MRVFALIALLCSVAALLCAWLLPVGPLWYASLYALPLAATLLATAIVGALFERFLGPEFESIAAAFAVALMFFAVLYAIYEGPVGVLFATRLRLEELGRKAASIAALGAALGALIFAFYSMRSPMLAAKIGAALTIGAGVLLARPTAIGFGLGYLSWRASGIVAALLFAIILFVGMKLRARARAEDD